MAREQVTDVRRAADPRSEQFVAALRSALIEGGLIDELAARRADRARSQSNERLDVVVSRLGLVGDVALTRTLSKLLGIPLVAQSEWPDQPPDGVPVDGSFLAAHKIAVLADSDDKIVLAVADPFNQAAIDSISFLLERPVHLKLATAGEIERWLNRHFGRRPEEGGPADLESAASAGDDATGEDVRRLEDMASEAPVIRLVHDLIVRAVESRASDIHIEPREDSVRVRYRIDGALQTVETLAVNLRAALTSRVKIMARLNIAERRLPQDGRIKITVRGREIDLRVSTMPTISGESVVLRILDRESIPLDFSTLGFGGGELETFQKLLSEPNGIILVTGPTGSGKTTTLYTALSSLNSPNSKLFTVEDPIEYQFTGINQINVNPKIGLNFASALRSILRQDPDIIMVGEIRDLETAEIAIRASLTGHLVLSTVHTNSAAATLTRLLDMGVEDYLLATSLKGVLAQRLVRRLCPDCAKDAPPSPAYLTKLKQLAGHPEFASPRLRDPCGCATCHNTGYRGRTAIYEMLTVTTPVRDQIVSTGTEAGIETVAVAGGMRTLLQNGVAKVLAGETTLEEVLRVTRVGDAALPV